MARWLIVSVVIAFFFIYLTQAAPTQEDANTSNKLEESFSKLAESFNNGIKEILNNEKFKELVKEGKTLFDNAAEKIQSDLPKLIPKTDGQTQAPSQ